MSCTVRESGCFHLEWRTGECIWRRQYFGNSHFQWRVDAFEYITLLSTWILLEFSQLGPLRRDTDQERSWPKTTLYWFLNFFDTSNNYKTVSATWRFDRALVSFDWGTTVRLEDRPSAVFSMLALCSRLIWCTNLCQRSMHQSRSDLVRKK